MGFPQSVSDAAFAACGRRCCICHRFCGTKMELHHIIQVAYGGEDTFENCIPLCFECHADMGKADPKHNKGRKYTEKELVLHRDNWYKVVKEGEASKGNYTGEIEYICAEDRQLYSRIVDTFSRDIQYELKYPNFYSPYERNFFQPLDYLEYEADDPAFFFINEEMESLRSSLFNNIEQFTQTLYGYTYSVGIDMPDKNASHGWLLNHGYINEEQFHQSFQALEKEFEEEANQINASAKKLWRAFSEFVKRGKILYSNQYFREESQG